MSVVGPLAGRTIVVTRPQAQAAPLAAAISAAGGKPLSSRCSKFRRPMIPGRWRSGARLAEYAWLPSSARMPSNMPCRFSWRTAPGRPAVAGGRRPGHAQALAAHGVGGCIAPTERFDSEALLALPELAAERVAGRRIAIFRGDGGRELLADTLRERGASVDCITCYRRSGPSHGLVPLLAAWRGGQLDALTVSSSEGLRYLVDLLDAEGFAFLQKTPLFVPHARIAENARALGLSNILLTDAADAGILAGLLAYNWPQ
jgi:uroporphyrinogen-III synthase